MKNLLYRFKYLYGRNLNLKVPVDISLELASTCNQRCSYCYHGDPGTLPFKRRVMPFETAKNILWQGREIGVNSTKLNWRGEPTMNQEFGRICKYAKALASGMTYMDRLTNSNFQFDHERNDIFEGLACQTKVKISYDSFDEKTYTAQRIRGKHRLISENIDKFYRWKGRKTEIVIQAVRTNLNKNEDIESHVKSRWPSASVSIRDCVSGRNNNDVSDLSYRSRDGSKRTPCRQAFVRLIFDYEGNAYTCCPDIKGELKLGNINDKTMTNIFNGSMTKSIRSDLKTGRAFDLDPCRTCSSFESFKGYSGSWKS